MASKNSTTILDSSLIVVDILSSFDVYGRSGESPAPYGWLL
jgi:hypothetical protein